MSGSSGREIDIERFAWHAEEESQNVTVVVQFVIHASFARQSIYAYTMICFLFKEAFGNINRKQ